MDRLQHPSNNQVLLPPKGATAEDCKPLPVTVTQDQEGRTVTVSFWKPDAAEMKLLQAGKPVMLFVWATSNLAPVWVGVEA
jgi:hypothetical protein